MERVVIVGGGVSGLALAFWLQRLASEAGRPLRVTVLEAEETPGGKMRTEREGPYRVEWGPNGFLDSKVHAVRLVEALGMGSQVLQASLRSRTRYITRHGRPVPVPESPLAFLRSPLISVSGKIRLLGEPFAPPAPPNRDETVAEFVRRRIGPEALAWLIDPMVSGVFAGDPEALSLAAVFPRMVELERDHGGLFRALWHLGREKRRSRRNPAAGGMGQPTGVLTSFREGSQSLVETLAGSLAPGTLICGARVQQVHRSLGGSVVEFRDAQGSIRWLPADRVVLACPSYEAARMIRREMSDLAMLLDQIPYAPISVVGTAFEARALQGSPRGFGVLHPRVEGRGSLGTLYDSLVFENRAPEGQVLLRTMVGGARDPVGAMLPDEALLDRVLRDLREVLGVRGDPVRVWIFRHDRGIPQYLRGHPGLLRQVDLRVARWPGLHLCSNAYRGIALGDCCREAETLARQVVPSDPGPRDPPA
ncbi:MAG TPA: protoporphyrinogen oxidase [Myxococcota bacterium]|nr:protoporphyrinogen oxidase [Myxococcota bacterium]HQK50818.1 protoporphyrinogen oxidase [Myxococcota bacterium]